MISVGGRGSGERNREREKIRERREKKEKHFTGIKEHEQYQVGDIVIKQTPMNPPRNLGNRIISIP